MAEEKLDRRITFVLTSCGRMDLLEQTLDSFFKYNEYPIERYLITEDSADPEIFKQCEELNQRKYEGKLEFIFNHEKLGHLMSVDKAYGMVETPYVFHCQEDWEFLKGDFIEPSIKVLETQPKVIQCWIRPKSDGILNEMSRTIYSLPGGVRIRMVEETTYIAPGAQKDGTDLVVHDYMGFSFNPGVKRISDWKLLPNGYAPILREHLISEFYKKQGYIAVTLCLEHDNGYVKHIGWNRRTGDLMFQRMKENIAIIGNGEIGSSLAKVYEAKEVKVMIKDLDLDTIDKDVNILNICLPYSDKFVEITNSYIEEYKPEVTIVHSTVPVGTTKKLKGLCVHSPVRGVHPNLKEGIETFFKFVGYNDQDAMDIVKKHYEQLDIRVHAVENTDATELAKLTSTTYYGLCIAWHGEMKKMCDKYDIDFDVINKWTDTYNLGYMKLGMSNVIRPNLYPPTDGIGGHCVIPNTELLKDEFESMALDLILKYKKLS